MASHVTTAGAQGEDFEASFLRKLGELNLTQQSINTLTLWIKFHNKKAKQAATIWARETLNSPEDRQLLLVYLLNDVIQNVKKTHPALVNEFIEQMRDVLPRVHARAPAKIRAGIERVVTVLKDRGCIHESPLLAGGEGGQAPSRQEGGQGPASLPAPSDQIATPPTVDLGKALAQATGKDLVALLPRLLSELGRNDAASNVRDSQQTISTGLLTGDVALGVEDMRDLAQLDEAADAASDMLGSHLAVLDADVLDRKRLIVLLCTAIENQENIIQELEEAREETTAKQTQVEATKERLKSVRRDRPRPWAGAGAYFE